MPVAPTIADGLLNREQSREFAEHSMRCAGCGAKLAGNLLGETLAGLEPLLRDDTQSTVSTVEDAAQIQIAGDRKLVQSVDALRDFIDDPYVFGRIATLHCLSDLYAMGCQAHSAQALVTLPYAAPRYLRSELLQLMQGCNEALRENDCALIGGHSAEGSDLSLGLVVNGFANSKAWLKGAVELGDSLILCRPLGSGCLLAADMRGRARHPWITGMLAQMQTSNRRASEIFTEFTVSACTDVTGFGLAGHLLEMLNERRARAEITLESISAYEGALQVLAAGSRSTLAQANRQIEAQLYNTEAFADDPRVELLFDPQTAGGLLAAINPERAADCVQQLRNSGYPDARIIGRIAALETDSAAIVLR
jgi:selenide,water dikinase